MVTQKDEINVGAMMVRLDDDINYANAIHMAIKLHTGLDGDVWSEPTQNTMVRNVEFDEENHEEVLHSIGEDFLNIVTELYELGIKVSSIDINSVDVVRENHDGLSGYAKVLYTLK